MSASTALLQPMQNPMHRATAAHHNKGEQALALLWRSAWQGRDLETLVDTLPQGLGPLHVLKEEAVLLHPRHIKGVGHTAHLLIRTEARCQLLQWGNDYDIDMIRCAVLCCAVLCCVMPCHAEPGRVLSQTNMCLSTRTRLILLR